MTSLVQKKCLECQEAFPKETVLCPHDGSQLATTLCRSLVGVRLSDRYEVKEEIGRGGMGVIYKAEDLKAQDDSARIVAIKLLINDAAQNESMRNRFMVEARAASSLSHPNIIKVFEFSVSDDGLPFMVMEYLEGYPLADLLENGAIDAVVALHFLIEVCDALGHAHRRSVIHRDIKPSNIMIVRCADDTEKAVVVDFGIAKIFAQPGKASLRLTQTGEIFGSPLYMSPEQCMGQKLDPRSDVYALGCVIYECLTGESPFEGENFLNVIFQHINDEPPRFARKRIEKEIESVVLKALSKRPDERQQSMMELRQQLEHCLNLFVETDKIDSYDANDEDEDEDSDDDEDPDADADEDLELDDDGQFLYYESLAEDGDPHAQYELALFYREGYFVDQDDEIAFDWCKKAAKAGLADAQFLLGEMYHHAEGTTRDLENAFDYYLKAANQDHPAACNLVAHMYDQGKGVKKNFNNALKWLRKAAELEHIGSQMLLGHIYLLGEEVEKDEKEAVEWYSRAAEQGDVDAQLQLGLCYRDGIGAEADLFQAFNYFLAAAEQGHFEGQRYLALAYETGEGVKKDGLEAMRWMKEAALNGDADALDWMGYWYQYGMNGLPKDAKLANKYFREAAELGNTDAKYYLGANYKDGTGVVVNYTTAVHWLKQAAMAGHSLGQYELALCYRDGLGVAANETQFLKWMEDSANQDVADAQYELGAYYRKNGNRKKALEWLTKAAEKDHKKAKRSLDAMGSKGDDPPKRSNKRRPRMPDRN